MAIDPEIEIAATEARTEAVEVVGLQGIATSVETVVIPLLEERIALSKRRVTAGTVRVSTHTDMHEATAEIDLDRYRVEIERVPVGRVIDFVPPARSEGGTTIVSVVEERMVLVKQLVLTEELHIRHVIVSETLQEVVSLRRQHATVERLPPMDPAGAESE